MSPYETLLETALKLRPIERAQLIAGLIDSLDNPDPAIEAIGDEEALKRYQAYKKKRVTAKDLDEVLKKYE